MNKLTPKKQIEYLIVNILDHCNLKCKGCDHFSCIADPYFVDKNVIHNDLSRMKTLCGDKILKIGVMGGEPLLHPDLLEILKDVRNTFPNSTIRLTTNGVLLLKQNSDFWETLREENIIIVNTRYPIRLDFEAIRSRAKAENVQYMYFEQTSDERVKQLFKKGIDLEGKSNKQESFLKCHVANNCNFLMEGKFYGCPFSCQSYRIFCKKFNLNMEMTENDYLDIYKVQNAEELLSFAATPHDFCRYCTGRSEPFDWERSKFEINEWI